MGIFARLSLQTSKISFRHWCLTVSLFLAWLWFIHALFDSNHEITQMQP